MVQGYESADSVRDAQGRQYHIGVGPGEVAPSVLLVGDPARARRAAERFERRTGEWHNREYVTVSGTYRGTPVTVMATGIGCDNTEIAMVELSTLLPEATLIRAGTCGGLQPEIELGDLVVTWGAVRMEVTSLQYVPEGYPAVAHPDVVQGLLQVARRLGLPHHFGLTATASGFYGAQGRDQPYFPPRQPELPADLAKIGVKNLEMETSTLLTLATLRGYRAGAVCTAFANRTRNEFVPPDRKIEFEDRAVLCALETLVELAPPTQPSRGA
ncbi:MAG: nucleoside phosphorylase [Planctomycetota bacterium]